MAAISLCSFSKLGQLDTDVKGEMGDGQENTVDN